MSVAEHASQTHVRVTSLPNDAKCHLLIGLPVSFPSTVPNCQVKTLRVRSPAPKPSALYFLHSRSVFFSL